MRRDSPGPSLGRDRGTGYSEARLFSTQIDEKRPNRRRSRKAAPTCEMAVSSQRQLEGSPNTRGSCAQNRPRRSPSRPPAILERIAGSPCRPRRFLADRSIKQLQRKLNLPGCSGSTVDLAKSRAKHNVRRQTEINQIEYVEKFGAKL